MDALPPPRKRLSPQHTDPKSSNLSHEEEYFLMIIELDYLIKFHLDPHSVTIKSRSS